MVAKLAQISINSSRYKRVIIHQFLRVSNNTKDKFAVNIKDLVFKFESTRLRRLVEITNLRTEWGTKPLKNLTLVVVLAYFEAQYVESD